MMSAKESRLKKERPICRMEHTSLDRRQCHGGLGGEGAWEAARATLSRTLGGHEPLAQIRLG